MSQTLKGGRWEHCSPELLQAGIDCASTPRRPCECEHGGSHDHWISDDRLEMEVFDTDGKRVQWGIGPAQAELLAAHNEGRCAAFCGYCVTEGEKLIEQTNLLEAAAALCAIRDASSYNTDELASRRWEIANKYLDKHPGFGNYFDGNATKSHDPRGTLRNPDGSRSIFDDVDE